MDRHNRPYKCDMTGCDALAFGDAGGLFRHRREVHRTREGDDPVTEYKCPEEGCERQKRGFPRHWNLMEHRRRVHGAPREAGGVKKRRGSGTKREQRSNRSLSMGSYFRPSPNASLRASPSSLTPPVSPPEDKQSWEPADGSVARPRSSRASGTMPTMHDRLRELQREKQELEERRASLTRDIDTIKDAFRVLGEDVPRE
ncbi:MAG: hypothetical protein M1832_004869 [Thelocarpon impressellum]|nr:MAG: hypothetical protein M1832_004869 [Thelocarpon impressellum]